MSRLEGLLRPGASFQSTCVVPPAYLYFLSRTKLYKEVSVDHPWLRYIQM